MKELKAFKKKNEIYVKFRYPYGEDSFMNMLGKVKTLSGAVFLKPEKMWAVYLCIKNIDLLESWGYEIFPKLKEWREKTKKGKNTAKEIKPVSGGSGKKHYPFQIKGIDFIEHHSGKAIIGDEMGLGKTAQALGWLGKHPELRPALIICPASLKLNWENEVGIWLNKNEKITVINGSKQKVAFNRKEIFIINYDVLKSYVIGINKSKIQTFILDEIQYIKNTTKRTKAVKKITKGKKHIIGLSGTPIENKPIEFFNILNLIAPKLFPSRWKYAQNYCDLKNNGFGWDFSGSSNTLELYEEVSEIMIRRKKKEVLKDLPDKTKAVVLLDLNNKKEYIQAEDDVIAWISENYGPKKAAKAAMAETLVRFGILKQLATAGKIKQVITWIVDFLDSGEKLVVLGEHHAFIDVIEEAMVKNKIKMVKFTGKTSLKAKQEAVDSFNEDPDTLLFLGTIRAAGVGINLTKASNLMFFELDWTPGKMLQGEDRIHRIGQKNATIIWYLLSKDTIENRLMDMIDGKQKILDAVLDGKETDDGNLFAQLIENYKSKEENGC